MQKHSKLTKKEKDAYGKMHDDEKVMFLQLNEIKKIDLEKEAVAIWSDARLYFDKHLEKIDKRIMLLAKIEVYLKLRDLDTENGSTQMETADFLIKRMTLTKYMDVLRDFYIYAKEILDDVLDNGQDFMLDLYNTRSIDKQILNESMLCLEETKKHLSKDRKEIEEAIKQIDEKIKQIKDSLDSFLNLQ